MYFEREISLCENFIRRFQKDSKFNFLYEISTSSISKSKTWKVKRGEQYLNYLIKKYNLAYIGYSSRCLILRKNNFETEYMINMIHFNLDNYYSEDF